MDDYRVPIPASGVLYDAVVEGKLTHPNDEKLNARVSHAVAKQSRRRGWRLAQADGGGNIDAVVGLAMAVERASAPAPEVKLVGWI